MKDTVRTVAIATVTALVVLGALWLNPTGYSGRLLPGAPAWAGCRIDLVVSTHNAPDGWRGDVRAAAEELSQHTGLRVRVADTIDEPISQWDPQEGQVAVGWEDLTDPEGVVTAYGVARRVVQRGAIHSATISVSDSAMVTTSRPLHRYTLVHELGHVIGLEHHDAHDDDIMAANPGKRVDAGFSQRDIAMYAAAAARGCPALA